MGSRQVARGGRASRRARTDSDSGRRQAPRRTAFAPAPARFAWAAALVTAIAATLVRLAMARAWGESASPVSAFYVGDARAFLAYALHLVAGLPFDNGVPFHPPGWPFVLSLFLRATGGAPPSGLPLDPTAIKALVACLSGLSVGLAVWLASRLAGAGAMYAVALLGTFHFGHAIEGSVPDSEALYGLLVIGALALATRWLPDDDRPGGGAGQGAAVGAIAGFATLVRAEFALAAVLVGVARWHLARRRSGVARAIAGYAVAFAIVLTPSTVAHWRSLTAFNTTRAARLPGPLPRFAPVTSYGAFNFAMANHPDADGGPNNDHPLLAEVPAGSLLDEGQLDLAQPAVHELYVRGYAIGLQWIVANPGDALALMARKLRLMSGAFALGYFEDDWPAGVDGVRRRVDLLDPDSRVLWAAHLALVVAGAWVLRRRRQARWLLTVPALTLVVSTAMFFGYVRLGVAYLPAFWILQGAALAAIADHLLPAASGVRRRAPAVVLAAGLCLLAVDAVEMVRPRQVALDGPRAADGTVIEDETLQVRRVR